MIPTPMAATDARVAAALPSRVVKAVVTVESAVPEANAGRADIERTTAEVATIRECFLTNSLAFSNKAHTSYLVNSFHNLYASLTRSPVPPAHILSRRPQEKP